ncbi:hypothetical protein CSC94_14475 [Zhengella mangrovi]|uniref:Uncharacterized protein n=1 Tax=Zhengella mangrovi TaxID=1982044 RepID=A0A2G1QM01_9HYPH|nr:hypothetical protein [Zhengella mangrovi]PHP66480.1 hypothetical protein CSC94_14475 [Zhengella mangrovi]
MPVEPIGAMTSQAARPLQQLAANSAASRPVTTEAVITVRPDAAASAPSQASVISDQIANKVYETLDRVGVKLAQPAGTSAVDQAKRDIASETLSPMAEGTATTGHEGLANLSKAFDHAMFMATVNQVISGVSDTSRTLIKQS